MKDRTTQFLIAVTLVLAVVSFHKGGWSLALGGIKDGLQVLWTVLPLLAAAFLVAGFAQVLISRDFISRWLGSASGWRGITLACIAGALIPGGPYAYYPIAAVLFQAGAGIGVMVAFITAKNLWSVTRLPLEFALLGEKLTLIRFTSTLLVPLLLGWLADKLFRRFEDRVRLGGKDL